MYVDFLWLLAQLAAALVPSIGVHLLKSPRINGLLITDLVYMVMISYDSNIFGHNKSKGDVSTINFLVFLV